MLTFETLLKEARRYGPEARARLAAFAGVPAKGDRALFEELAFCIFAFNSSAEMGMRSVEAVRDLLWDGSAGEMSDRLKNGHRYWKTRPQFIVATREHLRTTCGLKLRGYLDGLGPAARDSIAADKGFKGLGMKEASHFLRNIGRRGHAILDKHILACLRELKVVGPRYRPNRPDRYRSVERRMKAFAETAGVDFDELDLLLWRHKTGRMLK